MPSQQYTYLNSTLVKEVARLGGSVRGLVPRVVEQRAEAPPRPESAAEARARRGEVDAVPEGAGARAVSVVMERIRRAARLKPQRLLLAGGRGRARGARGRADRARHARRRRAASPRASACARPRGARASRSRASTLHDAAAAAAVERTRAALRARARGSDSPRPTPTRFARDPLFQAAARVRAGAADCFVAGAVAHHRRRAARGAVADRSQRPAPSTRVVVLPDGGAGAPGRERVLVFADCGVVPDPTRRAARRDRR